jgi:hypothetical protein
MRLHIGNRLLDYVCKIGDPISKSLLAISTLPDDVKFNYIEVEIEDGKIKMSYLPSNRKAEYGELFTTSQRQTAKPTTVLKKVLPDLALDVLNYWIDGMKAHFVEANKYDLVEVTGEDIWSLYDANRYASQGDSSVLSGSCMRYGKCKPYITGFYGENKAISAVGLVKDDLVFARALVWEATTVDRKRVKVLDRVYYKNAAQETLLQKLMKDKVDYIKNHQYGYFIEADTNLRKYLDLYVSLDYTAGPYPYLDTFRLLDKKRLYNIYHYRSPARVLGSTEGGSSNAEVDNKYKVGYVYAGGVWKLRKDVTLTVSGYTDKKHVVTCAVCSLALNANAGGHAKFTFSRDLIINEKIYICSEDHKTRKTFIHNDVEYKICTRHASLYKETCYECIHTPTYCSACNGFSVCVDGLCADCTVPKECHSCNVSGPKGLLNFIADNVGLCSTCLVSWVHRCGACECHVLPDIAYCDACAGNTCDACDVVIPAGNENIVNCGRFCETHYQTLSYCSGCDNYSVASFTDYCDTCSADRFTCFNCDMLMWNDDMSEIDGVCYECYSDDSSSEIEL